jgi:predicted nucleic acid-binding Zn ribbon protein
VRNKLRIPLPLAEILKKALLEPVRGPSDRGGGKALDAAIAALRAKWPEFVGAVLAAKSQPVRIVGNKLIVEVPSSVWASELEFSKIPLIEKIRGLPDTRGVEDIRFQIETRSPPERGLKTRPLKSFG